MSLTDKIAIITGGSRGIGRATAQELHRRGATVIVTYGSDQASADSLVAELGAERCSAIQSDASSVEAGQALVDAVVGKHGRIDILVANAATMFMKTLAQITPSDFDRIFTTNVRGPLFLIQAAAPHVPAGGSIVMLSSSLLAVSQLSPTYLLYNATKGAIEQSMKCLAKELAPKKIRVNVVAPGPTGTELFFQGKTEQLVDTIKGFSPFNRLGEPREQAEAIAAVCEMSWVSGQVLRVNGAMTVG